jgi:preprotein translocase subunit SecG
MSILLTFIHYVVCIFLIIVVLLQSGKAADLAGAFGGMGSQTVFGPRGSATVLSKATTIAAVLFMVTSLSLSIIATHAGKAGSSVLDKAKSAPTQQKGATPQPGSTVPITVTPIGPNGEKGAPQTVPAPVVPAPKK